MEAIILPHFAAQPLQVGLFKDVQNASFLRQQLLDGNTEFEYAFLDASILLSRNHVLVACFRALNDLTNDRLRSRNIHSEIVFSLSPNNNIAESFRRFGISEDSKHVLAIKVGDGASQIEAHLTEHVKGDIVPFTDDSLAAICDYARIRKVYKCGDMMKGGQPNADKIKEAEAFIIGSMALKGS